MNYKTFALAVLVALALVLCAVACESHATVKFPPRNRSGGGDFLAWKL